MRALAALVVISLVGCRTARDYMVVMPPRDAVSERCIAQCQSIGAFRGSAQTMECLASCGATINEGQCRELFEQADPSVCVDKRVSKFSFWKTALLIGGIVVGGVVIATLAASQNR